MRAHGHTRPSISEANARPIRKSRRKEKINQHDLKNGFFNQTHRIEKKNMEYANKLSEMTTAR